jgi:DNA-binding CsgD family transcriptional regulator
MLLRKCAETVRGTRSSLDVGHRRRRRGGAACLLAWPTEGRVAAPPEVAPPELLPTRPPALGIQREATGVPTGLLWLWRVLGQSPAAREQWSELLRLATTSAEREVRAETLNTVGQFASNAGDQSTAQAFFQEALVAGRAAQSPATVARSLRGLAQLAASRGAFDLARILEEEALTLYRRLRETAEVARSLAMLGWLSVESHGAAHAETLHEESLTLRVTLSDPIDVSYSLVHLGWLAHLTGQHEVARQHLMEALTAVRGCADRWKIVALLSVLGRPSVAQTPMRQAVALLIAAEAFEASARPTGRTAASEEALERLDARALAISWGGGQDVEADGLVEQALRSTGPNASLDQRSARVQAGPMPLTPRELEVATLISQGHTNRRIAEVLVIAERTAETHARNIREKLGLTTRAQIGAWAALYTASS